MGARTHDLDLQSQAKDMDSRVAARCTSVKLSVIWYLNYSH
jgi:hypothetical protein